MMRFNPAQAVMSGRLLDGRVVVISGAGRARGIGKATARLFIEHGAKVALLDLDAEEAAQAARDVVDEAVRDDDEAARDDQQADRSADKVGARDAGTVAGVRSGKDAPAAIGVRCDVTSIDSCRLAIDQVLRWAPSGGRIDVLINNAGLTQKRGVAEISVDDYNLVTDVILRGTIQLSQAVIPTMRRQKSGSLVAISSMSAQQGGGIFGGAHYCAAKAGVLGFTRALAKELGADGIRANAISPGLVLTDFSRSGRSDEDKHASAQGWPLARAGSPSEIAGACLFLASDLSSFVTGATVDVNGGAFMA